MLEATQVKILDTDLVIENHEAGEEPKARRPPQPARFLVGEALPRQRLAAREEQEKETAAAQAGQDEAHAKP